QSMVPPHPSGTLPQFFCSPAHVLGVQPQTFGLPPPPQVSKPVHAPQSMLPPQPFGTLSPQFFPSAAQVVGVAPELLGRPAPLQPQGSGAAQPPQFSNWPQPSARKSQSLPAQVRGVHVPTPQTFAMPPPPQARPAAHEPQFKTPPHPSGMSPQFLPRAAHVV